MAAKRKKKVAKEPLVKRIPPYWSISLTVLFGAIGLFTGWKLVFVKSDIASIAGIILMLGVVYGAYNILKSVRKAHFNKNEEQ